MTLPHYHYLGIAAAAAAAAMRCGESKRDTHRFVRRKNDCTVEKDTRNIARLLIESHSPPALEICQMREKVSELEVNVFADTSTSNTALPECESKGTADAQFSFILVAFELQKNMMPQMDDWAHFFKHLPPPSENNNLRYILAR